MMLKSINSIMSKSLLRSRSLLITFTVVFLTLFVMSGCTKNDEKTEEKSVKNGGVLTLATTTSVNDSGLLGYLQPQFEQDTGIALKIIAQGTGQAIKTGEDGNADVLFIHDKKSEEKFVADGNGLSRIELMYNYFVLVGPKDDPAKINGSAKSAEEGFKRIMDSKSVFVSRGDESGTHKKELSIWKNADLMPSGNQWYVSAGKGMGEVLKMASEKKAYTLTDKATFLSMKDKLDLKILLMDAKDLFNQYTIIKVNPDKHKHVKKENSDKFVDWMTSEKVLDMINNFGKDKYGESLFYVNYVKKD